MTIIKWRDAYNTGVEQFDMEHHKIVELIDIMYVAIRDQSSKQVVVEACENVLSYTDYHFTNEEQAMKAANYPELDEHIAEHLRLKEEALELQKTISNSFPEGTANFYHFLRNWLVDHIQHCDKKYGQYLDAESEV